MEGRKKKDFFKRKETGSMHGIRRKKKKVAAALKAKRGRKEEFFVALGEKKKNLCPQVF